MRLPVTALFAVAGCSLVATITLTAVVISDDRPEINAVSNTGTPAPETTSATTSAPRPSVKSGANRPQGLPMCLVGSWRTVDEVFSVKFYTNRPPMRFTGSGRLYEFRPDGTATETDHNVTLSGSFGTRQLRMVGNGTVDFTWSATDTTLTYKTRTRASFTWAYYDHRGLVSTQPLQPNRDFNEIYSYTCQGAQMIEANDKGYRSVWVRTPGFGVYG
ncbi:MAG: hypothetical protein ABW215_22080 [Kibdelosporangium sp.]